MEQDTRLMLSGCILNFSIWDDTIHSFVTKFKAKFNVYPNILLASDSTYRKIDLFAQKHPERIMKENDDGSIDTIETSDETYTGLSYFATEDYELECCIDYDLQEGYFTLIFDEAPDFSGEPIVEEKDTQGKIYSFRKSA